ncbi:metabotropic glutamate receptor 3-like [Saccoglossus kowalevskii]
MRLVVSITVLLLHQSVCYKNHVHELQHTRLPRNNHPVPVEGLNITTEHWRWHFLNKTQNKRDFYKEGDVILGGLFDLHRSHDGKCHVFNPRGLQWMYTMVYTIEEINKRPDFLPNVTLGYDIHDACADPNIAVQESLFFINPGKHTENQECGSENKTFLEKPITVIGPRTSTASKSVASLLGLFNITQISYASTSQLLSNPRFGYFMRTVPPDGQLAAAMADFIKYFGWQTVAALYGDDPTYGLDGILIFEREAAARNICIAYKNKIGDRSTKDDIFKIYDTLRDFTEVKVVVVFALDSVVLHLFDTLYRENYDMIGYTWIGSDAWSDLPELRHSPYLTYVKGMIGFSPHSRDIPDLVHFLQSLSPLQRYEDPFFMEFWEYTFNCTFACQQSTPNLKCCTGREKVTSDNGFLTDRSRLSSISDAVEAVAHAVENSCMSQSKHCSEFIKNVRGDTFLQQLQEVEFQSMSRTFVFLGNATNPQAWYDIKNLKPTLLNDFDFDVIGSWRSYTNDRMYINQSNIYWNNNQSEMFNKDVTIPESYCSKNCRPGKRKIPRENTPCCWDCYDCPSFQYSAMENALTCEACGPEQNNLPDGSGCFNLPRTYITSLPGVWIILVILAALGIMLSLVFAVVFIHFRNRKIVVSACAGHCLYTILILNSCSFLMAMLPLLPPSDVFCQCVAIIQFLPITALLSLLLLTAHIYSNGAFVVKQFIKKLLLILFLVFGQLLVSLAWMVTNSSLMKTTIAEQKDSILVDCLDMKNDEFSPIAIAFSYNFLINGLGIIVSFRTRHITDNFNEPKFIFFAFVASALIWVVTVGTFFSFAAGYQMRPKALSLGFTTSTLCY